MEFDKQIYIDLIGKTDDEIREYIDVNNIRDKLFNNEKKHYFVWVIQDRKIKDVFFSCLFEGNGCELFLEASHKVYFLEGLISSGHPRLYEFLSNPYFFDFLTSQFEFMYSKVYSLKTYEISPFLKHLIINENNELVMNILINLKDDVFFDIMEKVFISDELLLSVIEKFNLEKLDYILKNRISFNKLDCLPDYKLIKILDKKINLPFTYSFSIDMVKRLTNTSDVFLCRNIINKLDENNDVAVLEKYKEKYIEEMINSFNFESKLFPIYEELLTFARDNENDFYLVYNKFKDLMILNNSITSENEIISIINSIRDSIKHECLYEYLVNESSFLLDMLIIDYLFRDKKHDVLMDIKVMLDYIYESKVNIVSSENIAFYESILTIDTLDVNQKINLFNLAKKLDVIENFYDDIRNLKNHSYDKLREEMINDDNYSKYVSKKLTEKYGVPTIKFGDKVNKNGKRKKDEFKLLVKSYNKSVNEVLDDDYANIVSDGASFSYIGSDNMAMFRDPSETYAFVYTDFDNESIVHTFPTDSFTSFIWNSNFKNEKNSSFFKNTYFTPSSLVNSGSGYNEILISNQNENFEAGKKAPEKKYILVLDEVLPSQLESAKKLGLGLIIVDTKLYPNFNVNAKTGVPDVLLNEYESKYSDYLTSYVIDENRKIMLNSLFSEKKEVMSK